MSEKTLEFKLISITARSDKQTVGEVGECRTSENARVYTVGDTTGIFTPNVDNIGQLRVFKHGRKYFYDVWRTHHSSPNPGEPHPSKHVRQHREIGEIIEKVREIERLWKEGLDVELGDKKECQNDSTPASSEDLPG